MKSTIKIAAILLLFIFLKAESCSDQTGNALQETQINKVRGEIKSQFDTGFLSEASLHEHEKAAMQKLTDFADYLRILADSSLMQPYREKTGEMILHLFASGSAEVKIISGRNRKSQVFSVDQLIQCGLENELFLFGLVYDSIQINRNFARTGPDSYAALLSFIEYRDNSLHSASSEASIHRKIKALINRETRVFAADTLSVWVLRLGEME